MSSNYTITGTITGVTAPWLAMAADDYTPSSPGTLAINWALADSFTASAFSGSTTISFSNVTVGQKIDLILGSNGQTVTWPSGMTGVGFTWPPTLSGSGLRDEFVIKCIGTNSYLGYNLNNGVGF